MRSTRFITSGGEESGMQLSERPGTGFGVILTGLSEGPGAAAEARWSARGYTVLRVPGELARIADGLEALRGRPGIRGAGIAGYEEGGRFAFLAATRLGAHAVAAFRGAGIAGHLDEARLARVPMSLHFADDDARTPLEDVRKIKGALEGIGLIDVYRYVQWDAAAAAQAEERAFAVFDGVAASFR